MVVDVVQLQGAFPGCALNRSGFGQQLVSTLLDLVGDTGIRRPAIRRVVFEAAIPGRVMRRRNHDAVRLEAAVVPVVTQDGMRNDRCWCVAMPGINHHLNTIGSKYFNCADQSWL